jgi:hypothetical protein
LRFRVLVVHRCLLVKFLKSDWSLPRYSYRTNTP